MDKVQAATKGLKMRRGSNATVAQTRWKVKTPDNNKSFIEEIETIEDTSADKETRKQAIAKIKQKYLGR